MYLKLIKDFGFEYKLNNEATFNFLIENFMSHCRFVQLKQ